MIKSRLPKHAKLLPVCFVCLFVCFNFISLSSKCTDYIVMFVSPIRLVAVSTAYETV